MRNHFAWFSHKMWQGPLEAMLTQRRGFSDLREGEWARPTFPSCSLTSSERSHAHTWPLQRSLRLRHPEESKVALIKAPATSNTTANNHPLAREVMNRGMRAAEGLLLARPQVAGDMLPMPKAWVVRDLGRHTLEGMQEEVQEAEEEEEEEEEEECDTLGVGLAISLTKVGGVQWIKSLLPSISRNGPLQLQGSRH
jgi:hypothetical protein